MNALDTTSCRFPQYAQVSLLMHASTLFVDTLRKKLNNRAVANGGISDSEIHVRNRTQGTVQRKWHRTQCEKKQRTRRRYLEVPHAFEFVLIKVSYLTSL